MPKKYAGGGDNDKKIAAKEREESKKAEKSSKQTKDAEDAFWREAGEGQMSKAAAKRADEEKKRLEQLAKKAEAKKLAEEEEKALTAKKDKLAPAGAQKVTKYQLDTQKEIEAKAKEEELKQRQQLAVKREVSEDAYASMLDMHAEHSNVKDDTHVDARSLGEAVAQLGITEEVEGEKHPEKRMKAAWKEYEEKQLPELKQDKPGLKMSQYRDLLWKMWQKAPENPMVQAGRK